jgi:hypothetical protein
MIFEFGISDSCVFRKRCKQFHVNRHLLSVAGRYTRSLGSNNFVYSSIA